MRWVIIEELLYKAWGVSVLSGALSVSYSWLVVFLQSGLNVMDDPGGVLGYPQAQGDFELNRMQQGVDVERRTYLG